MVKYDISSMERPGAGAWRLSESNVLAYGYCRISSGIEIFSASSRHHSGGLNNPQNNIYLQTVYCGAHHVIDSG